MLNSGSAHGDLTRKECSPCLRHTSMWYLRTTSTHSFLRCQIEPFNLLYSFSSCHQFETSEHSSDGVQHLYLVISDYRHSLNHWTTKAHNINRDHVLRNIPACTALQVLIHFRDQPDPSESKPLSRSKLSVHGIPKKKQTET